MSPSTSTARSAFSEPSRSMCRNSPDAWSGMSVNPASASRSSSSSSTVRRASKSSDPTPSVSPRGTARTLAMIRGAMRIPREQWSPAGVYLNTASYGLPPAVGWEALQAALADWRGGGGGGGEWGGGARGARGGGGRAGGVPAGGGAGGGGGAGVWGVGGGGRPP